MIPHLDHKQLGVGQLRGEREHVLEELIVGRRHYRGVRVAVVALPPAVTVFVELFY
jgi:hypothetical protein